MPRSLDQTLDFLRRLVTPPEAEHAADADLVGRFVATGDEAAFALLLRRHGPMVLGICRRVLRHDHDAEEAFQATFLVLAAKARALRKRASVAAWLHGVAVRVATRAAALHRREVARREPIPPEELPARPASEPAFAEAVERELAALPETYRAAVLACDVAGASPDEAARALGWSVGALRGRLHRGRKLLRDRLRRHGWGDPATLALPAVLPGLELQAATLRSVALFAAGAAEGGSTVGLAEGVLQAMRRMTLLRTAGIGALVLALAGMVGLALGFALLRPAVPLPDEAPGGLHDLPAAALCVAVAPDGKALAVGGEDGVVRLFDPATGKERSAWKGHAGPVRAVRVTATEVVAAATDGNGVEVRRWDLATGREAEKPLRVGRIAEAVALSPDAATLALGTAALQKNSRVVAVDVATGRERDLGDFGNVATALAFAPDGKRLAVVGRALPAAGFPFPGRVGAYDVATGQRLFGEPSQNPFNETVAFGPDGGTLAVGDSSGVGVWDVAKGKAVGRGGSGAVAAVAFVPGGDRILTGGGRGELCAVTVPDGKPAAGPWRMPGRTAGLVVLADGKTVAAVGHRPGGGALRIWRPADDRRDYFLTHGSEVYGLAIDPAGREVAAAANRAIRRWNLAEPDGGTPAGALPNWAWGVAYSPDGKAIAAAGEEAGHVHLFDRAGKHLADWAGPGGPIRTVDYSPDGKRLVTAGFGAGDVVVWDAATGKGAALFDAKESVAEARFSPDGTRVAAVTHAGRLFVHDAATGKELVRVAAHPNGMGVRWLPDGKRLVTGGGVYSNVRATTTPGEVRVWDAATGERLRDLGGHKGQVYVVAASPDGKWLASGGVDGTVRLWDAATGVEKWAVPAHGEVSGVLAFLPDGKALASGGWDGLVRLWDVATGRERLWPD